MATIKKLNQTFVAGTEATAASQNVQNAKIDELIDIFGKETTGDTKTIAIPFTKDSSPVKVTTLGTGLSVSNNTLNVDAFNYATSTGAGIAKVGNGLEMVASTNGSSTQDKLLVKASNGITVTSDGVAIKTDSTLAFDSNGNLKVADPSEGKTYTATAPIAINSSSDSSSDIVSLSYVAPLTVPTSGNNKDKLTVQKATTGTLGVVQIGTGIKVNDGTISFDSTNYVMLAIRNKIYYSLNDGTKTEIASNNIILVTGDQHILKVDIFIPTNKTLTVVDSNTTDITELFKESGLVIISGALYTRYSKISGDYLTFLAGSYLSQRYTVTIS